MARPEPSHPRPGPSTPTPKPGPKASTLRDAWRVIGAVAVAIAESLQKRPA